MIENSIQRRRPPLVYNPMLPCGKGKCRAWLLLQFNSNPNRRRYQFAHWTGKIATATVDFKVGDPQPSPSPPPIVRPPVPGPLTKQQAIKRAHAAAERALNSVYQPVEPVKPAHQGNWITQPAKTARVTARAGGGWTIQWIHFPKAKGFEFNVKVDVNSNGATMIREAFAAYSR